ncbi:MAG: transcription-repair coupling factor [bacterium]
MENQALSHLLKEYSKQLHNLKKVPLLLKQNNNIAVTGLNTSAKIFYIAQLIDILNLPLVFIASDISTALRFYNELKFITDSAIEYLPCSEISPYEPLYTDGYALKQQMEVLNNFSSGKTKVIITTSKALLSTYLPKLELKNNSLTINKGDYLEPADISKVLVNLGYIRTTTVTDPGEFSTRGDILDIYPIQSEAIRVEFFGDEVENIRYFDTDTQRSCGKADFVTIGPRYKIIINNENKVLLTTKINEAIVKQKSRLNDSFSETLEITQENINESFERENYFEGVEYFAPFLYPKAETIFDYLPQNTKFIFNERTEVIHRLNILHEKYEKDYNLNINEGLAVELPYMLTLSGDETLKNIESFSQIYLDSFAQEEIFHTEFFELSAIPNFMSNLEKTLTFIQDLRRQKFNVIISTEYPARIEELLKEFECPHISLENEKNIQLKDFNNNVVISKYGFQEGFLLSEEKLCVITDSELFNKKIKKSTLAKKTSKKENIDFLVSLNDLVIGDYVVHLKHGIGKFIGLSKQEIDGQEKDYLSIEYTAGDRLHMPAEQINFLSRYRGSGTAPKLSKMGGTEWTNVKNKVKKSIKDIAQDLINLYAHRSKVKGYQFDADSPWQLELENAFSYTETPDQMQAIVDTKIDMESDKPMDRLVCGDVGFGKTEVALRAVFKAALSGKQAVVLVPTTILAQQHYQTFADRFKPYPVKVELLSRFRSAKEIKETVKRLVTGECDVVIGTHRLLQKDVEFKDLGILVIDEEHRFGVSHKEKLKQLRAKIDVLTLSATPIPRTLYMSISGVRDMSLINTPPVNRAPIKTYVGAYNPSLVKTAIIHELEREGQIYFVHNRVETLFSVAKELNDLVPDARIAVAHGQMNEKELEKIMHEFSSHEYDILVCTTIIESGLDIPNANTILVDNADKFGLAQLYQMRGRVGRSERQAYAYCFYRPDKILTKEATDRLKAIKEFTTLGSGYQIALKDLEIRGVGNILGGQQHGNMVTVGFDTYCSLLEEAVNELQGNEPLRKEPPVVDINITAFIPDDWCGSKDQKMIEYKRLADIQSLRELEYIKEEWVDRFGNIPEPVANLFDIIKLRILATGIGINLVRENEDVIRIFTNYELHEWKSYLLKIKRENAVKFKWVKAPTSSQNSISIINLNCTGLFSQERIKILEELFTTISKNHK